MRYVEIIANVAAADADAACDVLRDAAGADVWIERPFTQPNLEADATVDMFAPALLHAYVPSDRANGIGGHIEDAMIRAAIAADVSTSSVDEEDWAESWKEHFHVERFGERIVIVPSWREFDATAQDVVITLDPGMAFGTGQHETTRMCLEALERVVTPGARVLDVGCGSGILAITAAKLGAASVFATDTDENCIRITAENAAANNVTAIAARQGSLGDAWPFDTAAANFDVVVANIIARVIVELAEPLIGALAPSGRLIVSGIIGEREAETCAALEAAGSCVASVRAMGEWRCIEAVRA